MLVNVRTMYVSERNKVSDCKIAYKLERESLKLVLYNKGYVFTFADQSVSDYLCLCDLRLDWHSTDVANTN